MKLIDRFLKKLNTNRNTFATYILTLISIFITVDRLVELLFMIFTGVSESYWNPIVYTLAMACPLFAFLFFWFIRICNIKKQKSNIVLRIFNFIFYNSTFNVYTMD